ncbi:WhiB family transcriptional regulator [Streptomyces sp. ActVer]|uniref:WhiB family transcriptional regulator n=1 Tax=Streptomyces sp. ActVer TaxID=3014558 RepID=UPI0022B5AD9F|nr:WhiB family transcriptional regulator [Streptomyces sp. ActVer]MCZ4515672.1 WhiB family transcriptional regulator [Streptomyces sp. ActVer]
MIEASAPLPCRSNPDGWHVDRTSSEGAERLCAGCPVVVECLAYAMADRRLSGVWGGTTEVERRRLRAREVERQRRAAKVVV